MISILATSLSLPPSGWDQPDAPVKVAAASLPQSVIDANAEDIMPFKPILDKHDLFVKLDKRGISYGKVISKLWELSFSL